MSLELAGLAGVGGFVTNLGLQAHQASLEKKMMEQSEDYALQNQFAAARNSVSGMRAAGVNPALALKGGFSAVSAPSPLPVSSHPVDWSGAAAIANIENQTLVAEAQANKLNSEARHQDIINTRMIDEDVSFDANLRSWLEDKAKHDDTYAWILNSNDAFTRGSFGAFRDFEEFKTALDNADTKRLNNAFEREVLSLKSENGAARIIADAPSRERERFIADIVSIYKQAALLSAETDLTTAKVEEVAAHIREMLADSNLTYHKDFAAMLTNKDYSSAFVGLLSSALIAASGGAGYASGATAARRLAPTTQRSLDRLSRVPFPLSRPSVSYRPR